MNDAPVSPASKIIDALGGTGKVAAALDVVPSAVSMWRRFGIPGRWHVPLMLLAEEHGVEISPRELLFTTSRSAA